MTVKLTDVVKLIEITDEGLQLANMMVEASGEKPEALQLAQIALLADLVQLTLQTHLLLREHLDK